MFLLISKLNPKCILKYPFDSGEKNLLKQRKSQFFVCLATVDSISTSVSPTKGSLFIIKTKIN